MITIKIEKPRQDEIPAYAAPYIDRLPDDLDPSEILRVNLPTMLEIVRSIELDRLDIPYVKDEWTVKEVLIHIMDQERIYVYRALRFARHDSTDLAPMDHEAYVRNSGVQNRSIDSLLEEYQSVRSASLTFINSLKVNDLDRCGKVGGDVFSVRGIFWLAAAHETHHLNSIRENYLNASSYQN